MRRIGIFLLSILLLAALALPVYAETEATNMQLQAMVHSDGSCQVAITATLHLEQGHGDLYFPVPANAYNVMLGGSHASLADSDNAQLIRLNDYVGPALGDVPLSISYQVGGLIGRDQSGQPQLQLPLLSGFSYPIEDFSFAVTLPGQVDAKPTFVSGYHQSNIEKDLQYTVEGMVIRGSALMGLKDHETLTMGLSVPEGMFYVSGSSAPSLTFCYWAIFVLGLLALLYWLLTLRCAPIRKQLYTTPPLGYTAGQLGSLMTRQGADLTMMVFTWAQLGYVLIQLDRHGRALLHKRMEMGNERSGFERRCFQKLFAKRSTVDTTSLSYAQLRQKVVQMPPEMPGMLKAGSGNPLIFRGLCSAMALFFGVCIGASLSSGSFLQWLFAIVLGAAGLFSGWQLQSFAHCLFLAKGKQPRKLLIHLLAWLLFGLLAGQVFLALLACALQLLAGMMVAFGGRRTAAGRQAAAQVLGLRRYLRKLSHAELQQIHQTNPEFFHTMAPYALALGVDRRFAQRYGSTQLPSCTYLTTGMDGHMTASEWSRLMRRAAQAMDGRYQQLRTEQLFGLLQGLRKK